jgi:hypothetical protein
MAHGSRSRFNAYKALEKSSFNLASTFSRSCIPPLQTAGYCSSASLIALLTFSRFERRKNETSINRSLAFLSFGFFERPWFLTGLRRISQYLQTCPLGCRPIR